MPALPDGLRRRARLGVVLVTLALGALLPATATASARGGTREIRLHGSACRGPGSVAAVPLTARVTVALTRRGRETVERFDIAAAVTAPGRVVCVAELAVGPTEVRITLTSPASWNAQLNVDQSVSVSSRRGGRISVAIRGGANAATPGAGRLEVSLPLVVAGRRIDPDVVLSGAPGCGLVTRALTAVTRTDCQTHATLTPADAGSTASTAPTPTDASGTGVEEPASWVGWGYSAASPDTLTYTAPAFTELAAHMPLRYTHLTVPFDALATAVGGRCVADQLSSDYEPGETWAEALLPWLQAARAAGEQPMLSITWGAASVDDAGVGLHELNRNPTDAEYRCGLAALMKVTRQWSAQDGAAAVTEWEAFNEPDVKTCATQAASYYVDAVDVDAALGRKDTIVAGGFRDWDDPYIDRHVDCGHASGDWYIPDYVRALERDGVWPRVFSLHPFVDVSASGAYEDGDLSVQVADTLRYLNSQPEPPPAVWLTESGVWLENQVDDASGVTFGSELDGSPLKQAWGAVGFLNLAYSAGQAYRGQVARIYWYEFQPDGDGQAAWSAGFDSGLMGISAPDWTESGRYDPAAGEYAVPRASYCVLAYGDSPDVAVTDPRCDWSAGPENPSTDWELAPGDR